MGSQWLDLASISTVELSSEAAGHPIENALAPSGEGAWRAAGPGVQIIRIVFDTPQALRRIRLHFVETVARRTQEITISWSGESSPSLREILRQQWNFSPEGAVEEIEEWEVGLPDVATLELRINPDVSGSDAIASMTALRLA
jgi:hypothetical protein